MGPLLILAVVFVPPLRHVYNSGVGALTWALGRNVDDSGDRHPITATTSP